MPYAIDNEAKLANRIMPRNEHGYNMHAWEIRKSPETYIEAHASLVRRA